MKEQNKSVGKFDRNGINTFFNRKAGVSVDAVKPSKNAKKQRKSFKSFLKKGLYD